jgi:hypothetical protein
MPAKHRAACRAVSAARTSHLPDAVPVTIVSVAMTSAAVVVSIPWRPGVHVILIAVAVARLCF